MIRKLVEKDREKVLQFLKKESALNLFIIGDIENFGFYTDFHELWAQLDLNSSYKAVLLRYFNSFVLYAKDDGFDVVSFADIIKNYKDSDILSGKKSVIDPFEGYIDFNKSRNQFFAELPPNCAINRTATPLPHGREKKHDVLFQLRGKRKGLSPINIKLNIQRATIKDCEELYKFRRSIEEFSEFPFSLEAFKKTFKTNTGRTFYIREDNRIVSSASTTAENSSSAMIIGVCTLKEYRNRGYATACITALCNELLEKGKSLCLFYDNADAGRIYQRMGFREIGMWCMKYLNLYPSKEGINI